MRKKPLILTLIGTEDPEPEQVEPEPEQKEEQSLTSPMPGSITSPRFKLKRQSMTVLPPAISFRRLETPTPGKHFDLFSEQLHLPVVQSARRPEDVFTS